MDLETNQGENYALQPMHLQENYLKQPSKKEELPFGAPSSQGFMQDFQHIDQFHHANASLPNQVIGVQTQNFDPFVNINCGCTQSDFDGYESKPFVENNGSGSHAHVMDIFQYEGYSLNFPRKNQMDIMPSNQSYLPFNPLEAKSLNFSAPDEVSCISPANYYRRKEVWTEEEDKILIQAHAEIGNKWAEIAKRLPGRTENSIKNHWNATKRRQYSKRKCRSKYPRGTILQDYIKSLNLDKNPPIDYRKRSSANAMRVKASTSKTSTTQPHSTNQVSSNDRMVPNYEFNEVSDFCFDDNMFQEGCSIDSLLDDMPCAPTMDEKDCDGKMQSGSKMKGKQVVNVEEGHDFESEMPQEIEGNVVKKELDLVEMMSQVNQSHDN
ncbi:unnamed protein product [Lupinus luteus]|uniref:Uncharacterized protein n=1 Tax=Lupinus luteus TaxID=3873 RepID=A0AAV1XVM5_LUPLU